MNAKEYAKNAARSTTRVGLAGLIRSRMDQIIEVEGAISRVSTGHEGALIHLRPGWVERRSELVEELAELHAEFLKGGA